MITCTCTFTAGAVDLPSTLEYTIDFPLIVFLSHIYRTTFVPFRYVRRPLGHKYDPEAKT